MFFFFFSAFLKILKRVLRFMDPISCFHTWKYGYEQPYAFKLESKDSDILFFFFFREIQRPVTTQQVIWD
jgi:hypothetical protein